MTSEPATVWLEDTHLVHVLTWRFAKVSNMRKIRKIFAADYVWCNEPCADSCIAVILRHAWLSPWNKHMTTGRINQISIVRENEMCADTQNKIPTFVDDRWKFFCFFPSLFVWNKKVLWRKTLFSSLFFCWPLFCVAENPQNAATIKYRFLFNQEFIGCRKLKFTQPDNTFLCAVIFFWFMSHSLCFFCVCRLHYARTSHSHSASTCLQKRRGCTALAAPPPYICSGDGHLSKPTQRRIKFSQTFLQPF